MTRDKLIELAASALEHGTKFLEQGTKLHRAIEDHYEIADKTFIKDEEGKVLQEQMQELATKIRTLVEVERD